MNEKSMTTTDAVEALKLKAAELEQAYRAAQEDLRLAVEAARIQAVEQAKALIADYGITASELGFWVPKRGRRANPDAGAPVPAAAAQAPEDLDSEMDEDWPDAVERGDLCHEG